MKINEGTKLGRYEIRGLIGVGGMGEVYRANDPKIGREVAIKVLPADFAAGKRVKPLSGIERPARLKLDRIEALKGDRKGQYSIRINDQWRICFEGLTTRRGR